MDFEEKNGKQIIIYYRILELWDPSIQLYNIVISEKFEVFLLTTRMANSQEHAINTTKLSQPKIRVL